MCLDKFKRRPKENSATVASPYLGTFKTSMPLFLQYSKSIWLNPVDLVAINFKFLKKSNRLVLNGSE